MEIPGCFLGGLALCMGPRFFVKACLSVFGSSARIFGKVFCLCARRDVVA